MVTWLSGVLGSRANWMLHSKIESLSALEGFKDQRYNTRGHRYQLEEFMPI